MGEALAKLFTRDGLMPFDIQNFGMNDVRQHTHE